MGLDDRLALSRGNYVKPTHQILGFQPSVQLQRVPTVRRRGSRPESLGDSIARHALRSRVSPRAKGPSTHKGKQRRRRTSADTLSRARGQLRARGMERRGVSSRPWRCAALRCALAAVAGGERRQRARYLHVQGSATLNAWLRYQEG